MVVARRVLFVDFSLVVKIGKIPATFFCNNLSYIMDDAALYLFMKS